MDKPLDEPDDLSGHVGRSIPTVVTELIFELRGDSEVHKCGH